MPTDQNAPEPPRQGGAGPAGPCPGGLVSFVHLPGDPWSAEVCVAVGARLRISLRPARGYRWTAVESTDPAVGAVTSSDVGPDGAATATVHAVGAGTVILRATTAFAGDPFGPPTRLWRLTVRVSS